MEGQGTIALEIMEELPDVDYILVPIGGGGLISGIACAAKQINPSVKIVGVEPEGAASALAAVEDDQLVKLSEVSTIADGTAVKQIGETPFEYIKKYVDEIVTVSDYELMEAFLLLVEKHKLIAEGSGILSLAALKKLHCKRKKVVSLISGGNMDVMTISSMINKGLISRGRILTFSVQLQDIPGQLEVVSHLLNECLTLGIHLYFEKDDLENSLHSKSETIHQQIFTRFKTYHYKNKQMSFELRLAQIMYVESMNHKLVIHHDNGDFIERKNLSLFIKEINSSDFIQIHKSFVVNKNYIQEIKAKELILKNSTILPIGRNFKESI